jgi:predicted outer membrane repeat protein
MKLKWIFFFVFAIFITNQPSHAQENTPTACDFTAIEQAVADANEAGSGVIVLDCTEPIIFPHQLEITTNIVIDGGGATILDGGEEASFFSIFPNASLTLIGITFQNGRGESGGAISNRGMLTVINSHFVQNEATFYGGAIASSGISLTIVNSTFSDNLAHGYGGAINIEIANVFILNSIFTNNFGRQGGGAMYLGSSVRGNIHDSDFIGNSTSVNGGAIQNFATLTITNGRMDDNRALTDGGGVWNDGILTLSDMTLMNNLADGDGEAIWNGDTLMLTNTCISQDFSNQEVIILIYDLLGNTYDDLPACPIE